MFVEHKEVGEPQKTDAPITKLSTAIRIGSLIRPQCREDYFRDGKSCALGAAFEGFSGKPATFDAVWSPAGWAVKQFGIPDRVVSDIIIRNDEGWTREQIASQLEAQGY